MMASDEASVLFVHVQKTAGMTVDKVLREALPDAYSPEGWRHLAYNQIVDRHPQLADYWSFGFVRNPWARLLSWHAMVLRYEEAAAEGDPEAVRLMGAKKFWRDLLERHHDFEAFIMRGLDAWPRLSRPQIAQLRARGREVDFIGRQETFEADLRTVLERIGAEWPDEVPRLNTGPSIDYRDSYTDEMRDKVGAVYQRDLRRFGYEF